jgi:hypothetical protein
VFCRNKPMAEFRACIEQVSRGKIWANGVETQYLLEALRAAPSCDGIDNEPDQHAFKTGGPGSRTCCSGLQQ